MFDHGMNMAPIRLILFLAMMAFPAYGQDIAAAPDSAAGLTQEYIRQCTLSQDRLKVSLCEALVKKSKDCQNTGDYKQAKSFRDFAHAVQEGSQLPVRAQGRIAIPPYFANSTWTGSKAEAYQFQNGSLLLPDGQELPVSYASRDYLIVDNKECWFYESAEKAGRFNLADGSSCQHLHKTARKKGNSHNAMQSMIAKYWDSVEKSCSKHREKYREALENQMKTLGNKGDVDEAAAIQDYLETFPKAPGSAPLTRKTLSGRYVSVGSGWIVEFTRNSIKQYNPGKKFTGEMPLVNRSPGREISFYSDCIMILIRGRLHKIANDTHRVLEACK